MEELTISAQLLAWDVDELDEMYEEKNTLSKTHSGSLSGKRPSFII